MAVPLAELLTVFDSDVKGFERGKALVQKGLKETATEAERMGDSMKSSADKGVSGYSSLASKFTSLKGTVTALAGPLSAAAGILGGLGAGLLKVAKDAADAGSEIHDLSVRTGISVELLSSFRQVAKQSGDVLDDFANGVSKFNRLISEAARGSDEARESLKRFGVDPQSALKDQQGALAKVFQTINSLPPGIERATAAQLAFGKSGDRLVDMIQNVGGNLDEFMRQAEAAGLVMSTDAANAADDFGDKLDALSFSAEEAERKIGQALIPGLTRALDGLNDAMAKHGDAINILAIGISSALEREISDLEKMVSLIKVAAAYAAGGQVAAMAVYGAEFGPKPLETKVIDYGNSVPYNRGGDFFKPKAKKEGKSDAERETERSVGIIKKLSDELSRLKVEYATLYDSEAKQQQLQLALSSGAGTLTNEYRTQADEILRSIKAYKERITAGQAGIELQKTLNAYIDQFHQVQGDATTEVDKVTAALAKFVDAGGVADETYRRLAARALEYAQRMDDAAKAYKGWVDLLNMPKPNVAPVQVPYPTINQGEGPVVTNGGTAPTVGLRQMLRWRAAELDAMKMEWNRTAMEMADAGEQAFSRFFANLGQGWKGALLGLVSDFASALQQMAAQALASQIFSSILKFAASAAGGRGRGHGRSGKRARRIRILRRGSREGRPRHGRDCLRRWRAGAGIVRAA